MLEVGRPVERIIDDVPLGTEVRNAWIRVPDGWIHPDEADVCSQRYLRHEAVTKVGERGLLEETAQQFLQRAQTLAIGAAFQHGVNRPPIRTAFRVLGAPDWRLLREGMYVHMHDRDICNLLPDGTAVIHGFEDNYAHQGVWVRRNGGWHHVLGHWRRPGNRCARVISFPEFTALSPWSPPTGTDAADIRAVKRQMWEAGRSLKGSQSWCAQFEETLARLCIDEAILEDQ